MKDKRLLVEVPHDFHLKVKKLALEKGCTISQYIIGALIVKMGQDSKN